MSHRFFRPLPLSFVLVLLVGCGGSDDGALYGGDGGTDAGVGGGGSGGSGATAGGATGGTAGSGATGAVGGSAGSGATGAVGGSAGSGATGAVGGSAGSGATGAVGGSAGSGATGAVGGAAGSGATGGAGGTGPSCVGSCGSGDPVPGSNPPCYCDSVCKSQGDCCGDYDTVCAVTDPKQVHCGGSTCSLSNSYCCQQWNNQTSSYQPQCRPDWQNCYGVNVTCDGPEDCDGGQICCGQLSGSGNYYTVFECRSPSQCSQSGGGRIVCGGSPQVCPSGLTCASSSFLPEYNVCKTTN